jgi:hypothetical protein
MEPLRTTVGQLNFFRWAIQNKVIQYIQVHLADIEHDMNDVLRGGNTTKKSGRRRKSRRGKQVRSHETVMIKSPSSELVDQLRVSLSSASFPNNSVEKESMLDQSKNMTLSATKKVNKHNVTITVNFD